MIRELLTAVWLVVATVLACGLGYPLGVLAFAAVAAPEERLGSLVETSRAGPRGSRLVGQAFHRPDYFWPRPSAADFDASAAGGSNLSPTNPRVRARAEKIIRRLSLPDGAGIPADLLTASGSGLDPHISLAGALVQVRRVARHRRLEENELRRYVERCAEPNALQAFGGEPLVNVLLLNIALDKESVAR